MSVLREYTQETNKFTTSFCRKGGGGHERKRGVAKTGNRAEWKVRPQSRTLIFWLLADRKTYKHPKKFFGNPEIFCKKKDRSDSRTDDCLKETKTFREEESFSLESILTENRIMAKN